MNRTASTAKKLIKYAYKNPTKRKDLLPKIAALLKFGNPEPIHREAVSDDTADFIEWVLNTQEQPLSPSEVRAIVTRIFQIPTQPPMEKRPGPRFQKGDLVLIKKDKHKDVATIGPYSEYNGKIGIVYDTEGMDVLVVFKGVQAPVRFEGGLKPQGVGIYKHTPPFTIQGSDKMEMVYFADPSAKTTKDQKAVVELYKGRGKGEKRSANYYTGFIATAQLTQGGGWVFKAMPQQRLEVDPNSEAGYQFRSFNPAKGSVLYLGVFGKRPSSWKKELEDIRKAAGKGAESSAKGTHKEARSSLNNVIPFPVKKPAGPPPIPDMPRRKPKPWEVSILADPKDPIYKDLVEHYLNKKYHGKIPPHMDPKRFWQQIDIPVPDKTYQVYLWAVDAAAAIEKAKELQKKGKIPRESLILRKNPAPRPAPEVGITELGKVPRKLAAMIEAGEYPVFIRLANQIIRYLGEG